ncbi:MAG TPA: O-antigen ligase family protein [Candidatus Paceibacterota bacterium]
MLLKSAKFFLNASVFAVVLVAASNYFPFIGVKYYFFRWMVEFAAVCTLLWWGFNKGNLEERIKKAFKKPIVRAVTVFAIAYTLAAVFAWDAHSAFWSNFERGEGGFQMLHYYLFFLLLTVLFDEERDWKILFRSSLAAATLMILYGVMAAAPGNQSFLGPYSSGSGTIAPTLWNRLTATRFQGSLGNPAYVSIYLIFMAFFGMWLWFWKKRDWFEHLGYALLMAFFFLFFWLAGTRGAMLGLMAGALVYLGYLCVYGQKKLRITAVGILMGLILLGALAFGLRNESWVQQVPGSRLLFLDFGQDTAQTRFWTWGSAWQGFKDRPILGWGPENFTAVFDKYFDVRHFAPGENRETWFDRAHSVVFDYLAETGIVGLLAYLSMFAAFYWQLWKRGLREHPLMTGLLAAMPVAYFVQGLALFDVIPIYISWFTFLAFAAYFLKENKNPAN